MECNKCKKTLFNENLYFLDLKTLETICETCEKTPKIPFNTLLLIVKSHNPLEGKTDIKE